jgi:hypothetical protein
VALRTSLLQQAKTLTTPSPLVTTRTGRGAARSALGAPEWSGVTRREGGVREWERERAVMRPPEEHRLLSASGSSSRSGGSKVGARDAAQREGMPVAMNQLRDKGLVLITVY